MYNKLLAKWDMCIKVKETSICRIFYGRKKPKFRHSLNQYLSNSKQYVKLLIQSIYLSLAFDAIHLSSNFVFGKCLYVCLYIILKIKYV